MKTLLIHPPDIIYGKVLRSTGVPYGLATIKAYCAERGVKNIKLINFSDDFPINFYTLYLDGYRKKGMSLTEIINAGINHDINSGDFLYQAINKIITAEKPKLIGFSITFYHKLKNAIKIAKIIKSINKDIYIVFGGPTISLNIDSLTNEKRFLNIVDGFITGDGEESVYYLIKYLGKEKRYPLIPNLYYKTGKKYVKNNSTSRMNRIVCPDYRGLDLKILFLRFSRNCYWKKCSFCDYKENEYNYFIVSIKEAIKLIKTTIKRHRGKNIAFVDNAIPPGYLKNLSEEIIKRKIKFKWACQNLILEEQFYKENIPAIMKKAGCVSVKFGLESMSDRILKLMNKKHSKKSAIKIMKSFKKAGIKVELNTIIGFPGETKREAYETFNFLRRNKHLYDAVTLEKFTLLGNTHIFNHPEQFGINKIYDNGPCFSERVGYKYKTKGGLSVEEIGGLTLKFKKALKDKIYLAQDLV